MAIICPTVTAATPHEFRQQMERISSFAERIHIDLADGVFTDNKLIDLDLVWWPAGLRADLHLMYETIRPYTTHIVKLKPHMVIVQAESMGNFYEVTRPLKKAGIKVGVAVLAHTSIETIRPALQDIDHVLVFSGNLGHFGGKADLELLSKVQQVLAINAEVEIGWDGGINIENAKQLFDGGVEVFNTGGAIQRAAHPQKAYATLEKMVGIR